MAKVPPLPLQNLSLVLGGAASGKSAYAEGIVRTDGRRPVYLATAEAGDAEMAAKIARHRARRGAGWREAEGLRDLAPALAAAGPDEAVLLDGLTLWLANVMGEEGTDVGGATAALLAGLEACAAPVVVVSDEVGGGVVPANALARAFREALGLINQAVAARADLVVLVVAGLPLALKGRLP